MRPTLPQRPLHDGSLLIIHVPLVIYPSCSVCEVIVPIVTNLTQGTDRPERKSANGQCWAVGERLWLEFLWCFYGTVGTSQLLLVAFQLIELNWWQSLLVRKVSLIDCSAKQISAQEEKQK